MASPLAKVGFQWSDTKRRAVVLLVEGNKSYQRVADELGITRITLWEWRRSTDFAAALDDLRALLEEETRAFAVANRHALLEGLTERRERLLQIVTEREEYHRDHQTDAPGATTGYLVKSLKVVGTGSTAYTETEYNVDRPLVTSLNDVETFGAKLAGILTDKVDAQLDIHVGPPTVVRIRDQHPNPYAPNNETNLPPPGRYEPDEEGIWRDVESGAPFEPAPSASPPALAPPVDVEGETESLVELLASGHVDRPTFDRRLAELQTRTNVQEGKS